MTAADAERKLAAIMFTDMVGYSALSQRDEALALALLHEHQCLLRPIFARHAGHEIKVTGDGFLVQFASALQAVRCAIAIQKDIIERNSSEAPGRRFQARIGLPLGDVEVRDGDVFGDGVNIAARVEPLADAGGICITGPVFDQVRNKIEEPLERVRRPEMKNIQVPLDVYRRRCGSLRRCSSWPAWRCGGIGKPPRPRRRLSRYPLRRITPRIASPSPCCPSSI